jgi:hypothetical protein
MVLTRSVVALSMSDFVRMFVSRMIKAAGSVSLGAA